MAEEFTFAGSTYDSVVNAANELEDMQVSRFVAQPSGVAFSVSVPAGAEMLERTAAEAAETAAVFNSAFATPGVEALTSAERITAAGAPQSVVYVTVSSSSGRSSTQVTVPQDTLTGGDLAAAVAAARSQLDALEGL